MSKHTSNHRAGFTLVELMVVALIVAILAAVAIPLMSGNKKRAMGTEADSALGSIRTAARVLMAETGAYNKKSDGSTIADMNCKNYPGMSAADLNGKFWNSACYTFTTLGISNFVIQAAGISTGQTTGITITLDDGGGFTRTGM